MALTGFKYKTKKNKKKNLRTLRFTGDRSRGRQIVRNRWHRERVRREQEEVIIATATANLSTPSSVALPTATANLSTSPSVALPNYDASLAFSPLPPLPLVQVAITDSLADTHGIPLSSRYGFIAFSTSDAGGGRDVDDVG